MMYWGPGHSPWMWLFMFLWWGLFAAGFVWLVRVVATNRSREGGSRARQILDERFAAGEVSAEEYEQRRRLLDGR